MGGYSLKKEPPLFCIFKDDTCRPGAGAKRASGGRGGGYNALAGLFSKAQIDFIQAQAVAMISDRDKLVKPLQLIEYNTTKGNRSNRESTFLTFLTGLIKDTTKEWVMNKTTGISQPEAARLYTIALERDIKYNNLPTGLILANSRKKRRVESEDE